MEGLEKVRYGSAMVWIFPTKLVLKFIAIAVVLRIENFRSWWLLLFGCHPKVHVLEDLVPEWWYWELVGPLIGKV
jgi:hypothetical protein